MKSKLTLICFLAICFFNNSDAQNSKNPWLVAYGLSGPQFTIGDQAFYKEYFNAKNWNILPSVHLKVGRNIKYGFSAQTSFSTAYATRRPQESKNEKLFLDWDLNIKYSFANGYILKEKCFFDPYIVLGGGMNYSFGKFRGDVDLGAGVNIWVLKHFGFFIQASYNFVPNAFDASNRESFHGYMHHTMGVVARFGKGKNDDKDGDGIVDKEDRCPDVPGKKANKGCPDSDGDGVVDVEDLCPNLAGLVVFSGCPDTDGDGIVDGSDECPTVAGHALTDGCPDVDGDGIRDKDDVCPTVAGFAALKGCPDSDADGIADAEDKCPQQAGPSSNDGCPEVKVPVAEKPVVAEKHVVVEKPVVVEKQKVQERLSAISKTIEFASSSAAIRSVDVKDLNEVVALMKKNPNLKLSLEGHADNTGNASNNVELSVKRAVAVYDYLTSKGISGDRLTIISGFGAAKPVSTNDTPDGRQHNRRVELTVD